MRHKTIDARDGHTPALKEHEYIASVQDGAVYVSFSGGKDSTVLKHIVDSMYDDVPAVFINTGLEYPEIQQFVRNIKAGGGYECFSHNVEIIRPEMRFDEVIKTYGYPIISKDVANKVYYAHKGSNWAIQRMKGLNMDGSESLFCQRYVKYTRLIDAPFLVSGKCCDIMKKSPVKKYGRATGRKPIIGTMAGESMLRQTQWMRSGCNAFDGDRARSAPLSFWTEQDILQYIREFNVPYCSVYGEIQEATKRRGAETRLITTGCSRTGCMFCMFGCHLEKQPNRFQTIKTTHPRQYEYCIGGGEEVDGKWQPSKDGLGLAKVLDYIGVPYE